jgi:diaminohydroxyphosphoribosylaminopyrimidine deaminase/5-amino-6-(5-phosphoribosylamino)uracil reductase
VVLSPDLSLDPGARVFRDPGDGSPPTRVYVASDLPEEVARRFEGVADVIGVPDGENGLDLREVLRDLGRVGVQSVLVEGGGRTHGRFVEEGLGHRGAIFVSGRLLGARGGTPLLDVESVLTPDVGWRLGEVSRLALGPDLLLTGTIRGPAPGTGGKGRERCSPA